MDRSPRFRVYPHALDARFRLAFASTPDQRPLTSRMRSNSPDHNAKGTPSPVSAVRRRGSGSDRLYATRFQVLFHSPSGVLFTFPSRYYPLSVTDSYLALEDGPPGFSQGFTCPGLLGVRASRSTRISRTGLSPSMVVRSSTVPLCFDLPPTRPHNPRAGHPARVWALPFSLAATLGISLDFFSSRYLDVSVPWVGSLVRVTGYAPAGLPHSDTPGSRLACSSPGLFAACHVLRRRSVPRHPPCALVRLTSPRSSAERRTATYVRSTSGSATGPVHRRLSNTYAPAVPLLRSEPDQAGNRVGTERSERPKALSFLLPMLSRIQAFAPSRRRRPPFVATPPFVGRRPAWNSGSVAQVPDGPAAAGQPPNPKRTALEGNPSSGEVNPPGTERLQTATSRPLSGSRRLRWPSRRSPRVRNLRQARASRSLR